MDAAAATELPDGYVATHHTAVKRGGLLWMQEQVRTEAPRLDIGWVRGHAGDPLNEGADSLAKLARRAAEGTWGFTADDVPQRPARSPTPSPPHTRPLSPPPRPELPDHPRRTP